MKKLFIALICLALASPAWGQNSSKPTLNSSVSSQFPDNTTGAITPSTTRTFFQRLIDSFQQYAGLNKQVGTTYTIQTSDYGQVVTFNSQNTVTVTLSAANSTGLTSFNVYVQNVSTGNVQIIPNGGSTICGNPVLTLANTQSVWIISDGTNWFCQTGIAGAVLSNPIAVSNGGTGVTTLLNSTVLIGNNQNPIRVITPPSSASSFLQSGLATDPNWTSAPTMISGSIDNALIGLTTPANAGLSNTNVYALTVTGQVLRLSFGAPTISNGTCGAAANGTISGVNQSGIFNIGGSATTQCTVLFTPTNQFAPRACVLMPANAQAASLTNIVRVFSLANTGFVITAQNNIANTSYYFQCL